MSVAELFQTLEYGPAPEAANPALTWIKEHGPRFGLFINNCRVEPKSGEYFDTLNPATGQPLAQIAQASQEDVDAAVAAARAAFVSWSQQSGHVRARYLYALARQVQKHSRLLAVLETLDNGKPIRETRDIDIPLVARHFYYHAGWAQLMDAEFPGYRPVGVVGQIIPWNFPLLMLAWKVAPALAMGNTVVLKPAEFTSLTALAFAEIVQEVELPPGVLNIVTGDGRVGEMMVNSAVDKIAFTGSTEVGRAIRRATAGSGKRLSLELGGKSPFIVFDDADLDSVVEGLVDAIWFNQGQVCCAGSRLLVQENIEDILLDKVRARMERLRIGDPLDKAIDIGAIIAPVQLQKIERLVQQGVQEGAQLWQPSWACPSEGFFYPPTLFTNVSPAATIAQVEIFGPVLVSMTFRTPAEAVALANNTRYGLAASVWSENIDLALDIAHQIKAGTVWINSTNLFDAASGFGGYRESGFGREGGREGLYEYIEFRAPKIAGRHSKAASRTAAQTLDETGQQRLASSDLSNGRGTWPPSIDRTPKQFIGGKQVRPDSGYSRFIYGPTGNILGEVGDGNRKDIRNAVEAAHKAASWADTTAHLRTQILYYIAENLSVRAEEFAVRIVAQTGRSQASAREEVEATIEQLFTAAAWADKFDSEVHQPPFRGLTLAVKEPLGVMGIVAPDDYPLLSFVTLIASAVAVGNTVVAIPSEAHPLSATDLYQVLETSDLPPGVINIVTGRRDPLTQVLAEHDNVDAVWYWGSAEGARMVEYASAGNLKRTWVHDTSSGHQELVWDWLHLAAEQKRMLLREATQVKNIWIPYGA
jgi:aldehyde dehydrogenase (NAD+)